MAVSPVHLLGIMLIVLQWYRTVLQIPVALIHAGMSAIKRQQTVWLFQGLPHVVVEFAGEAVPQVIVGTTRLIGEGYTMTAAQRLILLEPEWLKRDEDQVKKRINRIGQMKPTYTYSLHCPESTVEVTIFDRHARREALRKLALDSVGVEEEVIKREEDVEV